MLTRRRLLGNSAALALLAAASGRGLADDGSCDHGPLPDSSKFESGDLLWPKKRDIYVPYAAGSRRGFDAEREQWEKERDAFVREVSVRPDASDYERQVAAGLKRMTFAEFHSRYTTGLEADTITPYGSGVPGVGHVAIVERDPNGNLFVIDAMPDPGVARLSYADWLGKRPCELVWHGRVDGVAAALREKLAEEAKRQLGKPYSFWNFKLDDDSGFYCSKLVWLSVMRAASLAIDGDTNPLRKFWLSPKQLLYAQPVVRLHNPADYRAK